jgi:hypothetical protein
MCFSVKVVSMFGGLLFDVWKGSASSISYRVMVERVAKTATPSIRFLSSRTLPGQLWASNLLRAFWGELEVLVITSVKVRDKG